MDEQQYGFGIFTMGSGEGRIMDEGVRMKEAGLTPMPRQPEPLLPLYDTTRCDATGREVQVPRNLARTHRMVRKLQAEGWKVRLTTFPGWSHVGEGRGNVVGTIRFAFSPAAEGDWRVWDEHGERECTDDNCLAQWIRDAGTRTDNPRSNV